MHIAFPSAPPVFDGGNFTIDFTAEVDGTPTPCAITAEALEDHFGAHSILEADLLAAFSAHRGRIEAACRDALEANEGRAVILRSGFFR